MRNQLNVIHAIDKYLRGVLDEAETQEFENRLKTDTQLQQEVAKQQLLMEGIKRSALKASAVKGQKKFKTIKTLKYVGVFVAAISAVSLYVMNQNEAPANSETAPTTELGIESLPTQGYNLNTAQDTVIETENGSVFVIPADAFETENGEPVTGTVNFEIKEAFEDLDIMKAGLTTTSDGELLETGGMFFLDATQNGQKLRLKKGKEILSQLPNLHPEKDMKLFDGEVQDDGTINWVNPKEFEKDLITVDITSLDFYPEGYVKELSQKKEKVLVKYEGDLPSRKMTIEESRKLEYRYPKEVWNEQDALRLGLIVREYEDVVSDSKVYSKDFTDSLYYSFARLFEKSSNPKSPQIELVTDSISVYQVRKQEEQILDLVNWNFHLTKRNKNEYFVVAEANVVDGWKITSNSNTVVFPSTDISLSESNDYQIIGEVEQQSVSGIQYEKKNNVEISFFKNKVSFAQKVKVKNPNGEIRGNIYYSIFNDKKLMSQSKSFTLYIKKDKLNREDDQGCPIPSGINPAKVKAIWNKKFNKTILATKEFEERMKVIHESRQDRILEVYINNLDKPLWYVDSIAMITFSGTAEKFKAFYLQKKGGVKVNDRLANKLTSYFTKKHKEFTAKSSKAFNEYESNKRKLRAKFANKKSKKDIEEFNRKSKAFNEEYEINRCEAYTQAYKTVDCNAPIPRITARITSLGPKNLDVYVFEATRDRKTMNYTDPVTGGTATLVYKPLIAKITNSDKFDKVFIYMLPDSLSSFNRMNSSDNIKFNFSMNMLFNYKLMAIGYKGKQAYFTEVNSVSPKEYSLTLSSITEKELNRKLKRIKAKVKEEVLSDKNYYEAEMVNNSREEKYKSDGELTLRIGKFLFPSVSENCLEGNKAISYNDFSNSGLRIK
ncbi:MAG: hypothetical protein ABF242_07830 [Flavobacteriales bacterium]